MMIIAFLVVFGVMAPVAIVVGYIAGTLVGKLGRHRQRNRPLRQAQDGAQPPSGNPFGWFLVFCVVAFAVVIDATIFYLTPQLGWLILSVLSYLALYSLAIGVLIGIIISLPGMLRRWWRRVHG